MAENANINSKITKEDIIKSIANLILDENFYICIQDHFSKEGENKPPNEDFWGQITFTPYVWVR
jgi:hypothetical protein